MNRRSFQTKILLFLTLLIMLLLNGLIFADGMIIIDDFRRIPPHPRPPRPLPIEYTLPVKYHKVDIKIENQVATTSIDQVFKNEYNVVLEGTYIFPLPEDASVSDFAMYVDGKRISGEILDKDKARGVYEDIVRKMKDPALLEYIGRNMFKARVYPIPANGEKRIEISYQQTLRADAGLIKYVYPLNTEKFSTKPLEEVSIAAKIISKVPIKSIYSPSHEIDSKINKNEATCGFEDKNVRPDKDFVLYYTISEKEMGLNLITYKKLKEDGYFMMLLSPGEIEGKSIAKDIVFILDTSGSMNSDKKIDQAKDALEFCVNSLGVVDRFNVISFATSVNTFKDKLIMADKNNIDEAIEFIDKFRAMGGTDIDSALNSGLGMFEENNRPKMIVFLTDGQPTVGITDDGQIVNNIKEANKNKVRVFNFGVGYDVNTHLLDNISEGNRGVSEYVEPKENIEVKVSSFYSKISDPVLSDIKIDFGKIKTNEIFPIELPDIFKGSQLLLFGRYEGGGHTAITLTGNVGNKQKRFVYEDNFPEVEKNNEFIPRLWATRKIGYLMNEIRLRGENKELVDEVVALSKEHGIITPYTSFLVVEEDKNYQIDDTPTPHFPNSPTQFRGVQKDESETISWNISSKAKSGEQSVRAAKSITKLKEQAVVANTESETVKQIGDKTFYNRKGIWTDEKYKDGDKTIDIKYLSDEYFKLIKDNPEIGKYLALGEKVIVVYKDKIYKIN